MMQENAVELIRIMRPAMPIKTYGAVSENSMDKSKYLCMSNRAHKPIVRRIKPVNWNYKKIQFVNTVFEMVVLHFKIKGTSLSVRFFTYVNRRLKSRENIMPTYF